MQGEVALLHLAQGDDVVAERPAGPENGVLYDFQHAGSIRPTGCKQQ